MALAMPAAPAHGATPEERRVWPWIYHTCSDREVKRFVGQRRDRVLTQVRQMNLASFRILDPKEPVLYEVVKSRLTLVVQDNTIIRAFCR